MKRATIDFGIDLGTTNSSIAYVNGTQIEVVKNNDGLEHTPSAVWLDKNERIHVGQRAKERLETDFDNAFAEFKLQMGKPVTYRFERNQQNVTPVDLSASVLKALAADVRQRLGHELEAAVITVPAAFELPQIEATQQAARRAGINQSPLLQEPVAAALAYGFQSASDRVFWLVYDMGGGTFDAAIIQVRDGQIRVSNHGGDNHLGGKLLDWDIVSQLLIPAVTAQHPLPDFQRGNPRWNAAIAKLKLAAEEAKIRLSRDESAEIAIDYLCHDAQNNPVAFHTDLQRVDVERLAEPYIRRAINVCRRILQETRLQAGGIEKVLLVGGPTMMPYMRERLADAATGLGIPLAYEKDPLTVVAQGAALFAGAQKLAHVAPDLIALRENGAFTVAFPGWKFKGSDREPLAAGVVAAPNGHNLSEYTVEFVNAEARPPWRSGQITLAPNGAFMTTLWAEAGRPNHFRLELADSAGRPQAFVSDPDPLTYMVGLIIEKQPLIQSMGVALANNDVAWLLEKGTPLPARRRCVLATTVDVFQGRNGQMIRIPVIEGAQARADRNRRIGQLEVSAQQVTRDVPAGSEIEFTVEVDESRLVRARAYIPLLDEEFEEVLHLGEATEMSLPDLQAAAEAEMTRLETLRKRANLSTGTAMPEALQRIEQEQMAAEVNSSLAAAAVDVDAADKTNKRLLDLRVALDEVEEALAWPTLLTESESLENGMEELVKGLGAAQDRQRLGVHKAALQRARQSGDYDLLERAVDEARNFALGILNEHGIAQVFWFQQLVELRAQMRDSGRAQQLISQGQAAVRTEDFNRLREINRDLAALLPTPPPPPDLSTVMRV